MKGAVYMIILVWLLGGTLLSTFCTQDVEASSSIFIRADGSVDPPASPIHTSDGITYALTDDINQTIVVEKNDVVLDGAGHTLRGAETVLGGIYLYSLNNVVIKSFIIRDLEVGIYIDYCGHSSITNNTFSNNSLSCIFLSRSSSNTITGNDISNSESGISLDDAEGNTVACNSISSNLGYGIYLSGVSRNNTIKDNTVSSRRVGIRIIDSSSKNIITGNSVSDSDYEFGSGIELYWKSHSNILTGNTVLNNLLGIRLQDVTNNTVFHNNFINNIAQSYVYNSNGTAWDNGCEGNYWSDYYGTDLDNDGVGDTYLPWEGVDNYPLMNLYWNLGDVDHDLDVDIFDVVSCAGAYGCTPSDIDWNPHCDVAEPYGVVNILDIVMITTSYGEEYTYT